MTTERETERERQTDRQRDKETDRETERETRRTIVREKKTKNTSLPENTVLVQGPTHPQKSVGELLSHRVALQGGDNLMPWVQKKFYRIESASINAFVRLFYFIL